MTLSVCSLTCPGASALLPVSVYFPEDTYLLRFAVRNWYESTPAAHLRNGIVDAVASVLAACDEIPKYRIKGVWLQKISGTQPYTSESNKGVCNDTFFADANTWQVDLVFQPTEKATATHLKTAANPFATHMDAWSAYLASNLTSDAGTPEVKFVGLMVLQPSGRNCAEDSGRLSKLESDQQDVAFGFWAGREPFKEVVASAAGLKPSVAAINMGSYAWAQKPQVGMNGTGFGLGDALNPAMFQPLALGGSITGGGGGEGDGGSAGAGGDLVTAWKGLSTGEKSLAVAAGLAFGYVLAHKFFRL